MMDKKSLKAIINLLDDPDEIIYKTLHDKLVEEGTMVIGELEEAWENTSEEIMQSRIESIIQTIQFDDLNKSLAKWKDEQEENLLYGMFLVAKFQYPELKFETVIERIENIKKEVWLELNNNLTALEKVRVVNHILFKLLSFKRNITNPFSPQNMFINDILESKKGNQISISILYAIIAQELNLPVYGVDLPNTFILAYKDEFSQIQMHDLQSSTDILFYINPYNKGAVFGKKEIDYFLKQQKIEPLDSYYIPCSNSKSVAKLIESLIEAYEKLGYKEKIAKLNLLLETLKDD